MINLLKDLY